MRTLGRMPRLVVLLATLVLISPASALDAPDATSSVAACQLGESQPGNVTMYNIVASRTKLYTLLDPGTCAACPTPPGLSLTAAWLRLKFNTTCSATLRISVVGWMGASSCPRPNPAQVLCAPVEQVIADVAGSTGAYAVPLPTGCCIQQRAFLCLEVVEWPAGAFDLGIRTAGTSCVPCVQRWERSILPAGTWDLCDSTYGLGHNLAIWTDAECCGTVPANPYSWGRLKVMYR